MILDFPMDVSVGVTGGGPLREKLETYYQELITESDPGTVDMSCEITPIDRQPTEILGSPKKYYGRAGERFIRQTDEPAHFTLNEDWSEFRISPATPLYYAFKLIEFVARRSLASDAALIHSSAVEIDGTTMVFPAWRHTGKTNTLLSLLSYRDTNYLADDRLWIDSQGIAYGFSLPIHMMPYNYRSFPELADSSTTRELRSELSYNLSKHTSKSGSLPSKVIHFLNTFYLKPSPEMVTLGELFPNSKFVPQAETDAFVFLQTHLKNSDSVFLEKVDTHEALRYFTSVSHHEWDGLIENTAYASDLLHPEWENVKAFDQVRAQEQEVFETLATCVPCYKLLLPREGDWRTGNITQKVLDHVDSVTEAS